MSMPETSSCPPDRPRPSRAVGWQSAAACAGLSPRIVFSKKAKEAAPALRACAGCTVRRACEEAVAPAENWFDGVCGGRLWRSGRPVAVPARPGPGPRPSSAPVGLSAPAAVSGRAAASVPAVVTGRAVVSGSAADSAASTRTAGPTTPSAPAPAPGPTTATALQGGLLG
ncbi:WhiB family transcriptional regulator [Streptomyces sp. NPDC052016]|uniref:WhiB family transcriptional regulator n=1 Tax=Streptomyces sp. NPDC052016 TaxID=3365680 RepID=UPI0037CE65CE